MLNSFTFLIAWDKIEMVSILFTLFTNNELSIKIKAQSNVKSKVS